MNSQLLNEYAELVLECRMDKEALDAKEELKRKLEVQVLQELEDAGIANVKLTSGATVFLQQKVYATLPLGKPAAVELLRNSEHSDIVSLTVNSNTLSALVRELEADHAIPEDWAGIIEVGSHYIAGVRKS